MKKILILVLVLLMTGCSNTETSTDNESKDKVEIGNYSTYEEVKKEYDNNIEAIMNKEQLRQLNIKEIDRDYIINKSKEAEEIANTLENNSDKIDTIDMIVTLDDLSNNTSEDVMIEVLDYLITEYEDNKLEDNTLQDLYIAKYLDKRLDNHSNMKDADQMAFDMYQICKDRIREDSSNIKSNEEQIDKVINKVKESI